MVLGFQQALQVQTNHDLLLDQLNQYLQMVQLPLKNLEFLEVH